MDFSLAACSVSGHETYAPDEPELRERLRVSTAAGEAWRCLRCGEFTLGEPRRSGPADHAPEVPRGTLLRDLILMRLLAVDRVLRAVVFAALGLAVLRVRGKQDDLRQAFEDELPLLRPIADQVGWNVDNSRIIDGIDRSFSLSDTTLTWIAVGLLLYALLGVVEAVGLWLVRRWGEYLAVIATAFFLPLEVYELVERVTALRVVALVVNIAAIGWLLRSKRLFGIRGGAAAYHAQHHAESLMTVERAAARV
jgi:uncharacterized membrane protein (DUF2068 family)